MGTTVFERTAPSSTAVRAALDGSAQRIFWLEGAQATRARPIFGSASADLVVVGGGYSGLWTALLAKQRDPDRDVLLLEARAIGWAASGRNGGFVDASLTHGEENGRSRWPDEMDVLDRLGRDNLDGIERTVTDLALDTEFERTGGLTVATEAHQVDWLRAAGNGADSFLAKEAVQSIVRSPTYLAGLRSPDTTALVHPGKLARELARAARELGVRIHEDSRVTAVEPGAGTITVRTGAATITAAKVVLGTGVFPSLLKRARLMTVPVYDYVLLTEPLTDTQLASIGWIGREGISDSANQFHYYRLTADQRILWGGYDAVYYPGGRIRSRYENRPDSYQRLAAHFLTTFPQLEGIRFSHRWAGAIDTSTRFCVFFGTAAGGRIAYAAGFTGLGVGATRFAGDVMLDLLSGEKTERTELELVRRPPLPFPPEPAASIGIQLTRRALDRADHREGRRGPLLKVLDALGLGFDS